MKESIILDWNSPVFQKDLFLLTKWELIYSKKGIKGENIYSFRINKKFRATALREANSLRILSLHSDHDTTYK